MGIEIGGLAQGEAVNLLLSQSETDEKDPSAAEAAAKNIANRLGGLPMALMIILSFAHETRTSLETIEKLLRGQGGQQRLLSHKSDSTAKYYEHTYQTVWESDLATLQADTACFLDVLSLLDSDHIPDTLFWPHGGNKSFFEDEAEYAPDCLIHLDPTWGQSC